MDAAEKQHRKAIQIDAQFYPAKVNLAMRCNQTGQNQQAEALLHNKPINPRRCGLRTAHLSTQAIIDR